MDSFDFNALDSESREATLSFLTNDDPTPFSDPLYAGFGDFGEPTMDWLLAEDPPWVPLGNAGLSGGVTNPLTESSAQGFLFPNPGWSVDTGYTQQGQVMGAEPPHESGELSRLLTNVRPIPHVGSDCFDTTELSALQGSGLHNEFGSNKSYHSMDLMLSQCLKCDWPSCRSTTTYATIRDLQNHQTDVHVAEVMKSWPGSCSWPGCKSKIFFKTNNRLESHVYNIHITPLCCTVMGCPHKRPFERRADLERHVASRHTRQLKYECLHPRCMYSRSFTRKDKLKQHERTFHGQFSCQLNHCIYGFLSENILRGHKSDYRDHGIRECGLGSCEQTSTSRFTWWALEEHLVYDHLVSSETAQTATRNLRYIEEAVTLTSAHFLDGFSDFQDCKSCAEKLKEAASSKEAEGEKK